MMKTSIRPWRTDDAASIAAALNNKKVQDNLRDGLPYPYTAEDARAYFESADTQYIWVITHDDTAVGSVGIFRKDNVHRLTAEIGYYIAEPYWGKGIVTEFVKAACAHVFKNTDIVRIFAEPFAHNAASCRVLEKAGFTYEGTLIKNAVKHGEICDMKMYALIKLC